MLRSTFALLLLALPATAGVYSSAEPPPFNVRPDGSVEELLLKPDKSGRFKQELGKLELMLNPTKPSPDRDAALARLKGQQSPADRSADLLRLGKVNDALNLLEPLARGRTPDFRNQAHLSHGYAASGDWASALRQHPTEVEVPFPAELPGASPAQVKWLKRVETQSYPRWLKVHRDQADRKVPPEAEDVLPLFGVRFVNDSGVYEPGKLAASEKAKLPPDAIAVTQQLLLWSPTDTQLLWLLAELYAADGRLREADVLFDDCAWSRQYTNRKTLMAHREAVKRAVVALPPAAEDAVLTPTVEPPQKREQTLEDIGLSRNSLIAFGAVFGGIAILLIGLQVRSIRRRRR